MANQAMTKTMERGLLAMAKKLARNNEAYGYCMSEPNENTGKALVRRGMIAEVEHFTAWPQYRLTAVGWAKVSDLGGRVPEWAAQ